LTTFIDKDFPLIFQICHAKIYIQINLTCKKIRTAPLIIFESTP
jgi:hypothetical protein